MCLPFGCCGDDHDTRHSPANHPHPPLSDRGDGYPYQPTVASSSLKGANHGYTPGNDPAHGRAAGWNKTGEPEPAFDNSDVPAPVRFVPGPKGAAEKIAAPAPPAPQTPEHSVPKTVVPTPTWAGAPGKRETNMMGNTPAPQPHVTAGARNHGPVATSQPKEGATGGTTQTPPVPQVIARDEDDDHSAVTAASRYSRWT